MSNPQPRVERPDDMGDVLAEIRRLVARGSAAQQPGGQAMIVTARVIAGEERQSSAAQSLALSVEVPMAAAAQQDSAAGSGGMSLCVDALGPASRRDQGTGHHPAPQDAPFRLNPDAMIPAAEPPPRPHRLRLTPDRSDKGGGTRTDAEHPSIPQGSGPIDDGDGTCPVQHPVELWRDEADHRPSPLATAEAEAQPLCAEHPPARRHEGQDNAAAKPGGQAMDNLPSAAATPLQPAAMKAGAADRIESFNREPQMQAYANSPVSPLHADSAPHLCERPAPNAAENLRGDEENPLRALLREVVREEFEGELTRSLDDNLRRMVRTEIAAALTEALVRRPRG